MAFGSLTTRIKTRTTTTTSTASTSTSKGKAKPRRSTSTSSVMRKLVPSSSDPSSSSSSDDGPNKPRRGSGYSSNESDFERGMRQEAHKEARAQADKEERLRLQRERKKYTDKGLAVPAELKAKRKKQDGSAEPRTKHDVDAVLANVVADRRGRDRKGKGRAHDSSESESGGYIKATMPTFTRSGVRKRIQARDGLVIQGADLSDDQVDEDGADEVMDAAREGGELSDDPDEVRRHLARRWVDKKNPSAMTARRKQLELKYNPLIRMLQVDIQVVQGSTRAADSDEERLQEKHIVNLTDPDTDWESDGMGAHNGKVPVRARREPRASTSARVKTDSPSPRKDAELKLEWDKMDEDVKPQVTPAKLAQQLQVKRESPEDVKPVICLSEDEPEPDTADEDDELTAPPTSLAPDVKPVMGPGSLRASPSNGVAPAATTAAATTSTLAAIEIDDSGAEPDTESDGDEDEIKPPRATAAPHFAPHTHSDALAGSSQTVGDASQLFQNVKAESQSQTQSQTQANSLGGVSQPQGGFKVKLEPKQEELEEAQIDDDDDSSDIMVQEDAMLRGVQAAARERAEQEKRKKQEEDRKKMQSEIAARRIKKEEEEREKGGAGDEDEDDGEEEKADGMVEEDDDEAPLLWEVGKGTLPTTWPQPVRKGRPKFQLESAQQASLGAHYLSKDKDDQAQIPAPINRFLRQYQREGAEFLHSQFKKGLGGILGDDMGLGKTIQVIAFLSAVTNKQGLKEYDDGRRKAAINERAVDDPIDMPSDLGPTCLIVCPTTVVHNWEREFQTWGYFDVGVCAGTKEKRKATLSRFDAGYLDVVIAGIEAVRNHIEEFTARDFTIIVVDEAHRVKNRESRTTQAMHQFSSRLRYGLTGTAMQNKLEEFWCVLNWAVPGRVGTHRQWEDLVSRPLKYAQAADAPEEDLALGRKRAMALVTSLLPNFWIRRTKDDVKLQLPPKTDNVVLCPLTSLQQRVYRRLLTLEDVQIMLTADDPCPCGARDPQGLPYRRGSCCEQEWTKLIFKYISLFQGVSNHLALMYPNREDKRNQPERYEQTVSWMQTAFPDDWQERKPGPQAALDPDLCGKWKILCELLDLWHSEGHKVLIFSMSLKILDLLSSLMETTRYKYLTLDGSTPQDERMPLVDEFNDPAGDIFCFLISTRAGGVGLNLTAANRVVIFDPNWNPSHDLQAMDRAYRFGQTRKVDVYRLIGAGTLEELIYNRQQYKRSMAKTSYDASAERRLYTGVQGEGKSQHGDLWGVKNIFTLSENFSLTEKSIERANLAELEYALRNSSIFETEDGKVADLDEPDAEEVVAEVTGYSKKADPTNKMTPAELARHESSLQEQATIARILSGVKTTESDAVIGGSNIELLRGHAAIQGQAARAKEPNGAAAAASDPPSRVPPPPSRAKPTKKRSKTEGEDIPAWDPLRRASGRAASSSTRDASQAPSAMKKPKLEHDHIEPKRDSFAAAGLPAHVSVGEAIAAAGYSGAQGLQRFYRELDACDKGRRKSMLQKVVRAWNEAGPGEDEE